ncbi:MAG: AAA family ATPase [Clostridia bacterium]|nr:AAA family ATPase [Clostridia bacterium]
MATNSPLLQHIYETADRLVSKYRSDNMTQIYILMALLTLSNSPANRYKNDKEYLSVMELFEFTPESLSRTLSFAYDHMKQNPAVSDKEVEALVKCYENAQTYTEIAGDTVITAPQLIAEILANLHSRTKSLFEEIIPKPEWEEEDTEDEELYQDETSSTALFLWPLKNLQNKLRQKVYGQDEAISALVSGYFNLLLNEDLQKNSTKPKGVFLFAGAPGVGKTHLAQVAAKAMHMPFRRFDMSGFADKESALEFAGSDKVYKNGHEGLVTGFVQKHPKCVLLFDEIEKAHINIIHLFLQMLDAGKLKDSCTGKNVLFNNAIIIMTTNAGKSLYENLEPGSPMPNRKTVINALSTEVNPFTGKNFFPEAICSRFAAGNIVLFNPLGVKELIRIGNAAIDETVARIGDKLNFKVEYDKNLCTALLFSEGNRADARSLNGRATNFLNQEVYNWLKFAYEKDEEELDSVKTLKIRIPMQNDAYKLFAPQKKQNILLYSESADAFENFVSSDSYNILRAKTPQEAMELLGEETIDFALCDIFGDEQPTLNIEDTASEGRLLMEQLVKEMVPTFVYRSEKREINVEEAQALMEKGASGFVRQGGAEQVACKLVELCNQVYSQKMLRDLSRSKKVLSFDSVYNWDKEGGEGTIDLVNLRVIPAVDAQDKDDIADVCMSDVTFDDVVGAEDAKAELEGFISYLKNPKIYAKNKIPTPKGVILYGPPGTGKTMLAKAFAHQSGAAFIATNGNKFLSSKVGGGAAEVRRLFALARKYAPAVLFIDEIDIVAKDRVTNPMGDDVVNALLNEMDGFSTNPSRPVFVLAATNFDVAFGRKSALDSALLRRFDRRIFVDLPNAAERKRFICQRLSESKQRLGESVIDNVVTRSVGMSLAELESVIDFALRTMVQSNKDTLTEDMFNELFETYCHGEVNQVSETLLKRIAVHESGHALISYINGTRPAYITIAGRGAFGGYVQSFQDDGNAITKKQLLDNVRFTLAGRAAEMVVYGEEEGVSTGASSDLKAATETALRMITAYGMSDEHGLMFNEADRSETTLDLCNRILKDEMERAIATLQEHRECIDRLVDALMIKNHLMGHELEEIIKDVIG